jgi:hypothetical protein
MARVEKLEHELGRVDCPFTGEREGGGGAGRSQDEGTEHGRGSCAAEGRP